MLVETVGVGQSEIDVETVAETVVLVLQPGSGDTLQFMKAGILEIPDVLVVHKWDLGAQATRTRADLEAWLRLTTLEPGTWRPPVIGASSARRERCRRARVARSRVHRAHLAHGELDARRARARVAWALELFARRYGSYGLERAGGERGRGGRRRRDAGLRARRLQRSRHSSRVFRVGVVELERREQRVVAGERVDALARRGEALRRLREPVR